MLNSYSTVKSKVRVSKEINEACLFETKVPRNKTLLIFQHIIPSYNDKIHDFFKFANTKQKTCL